MKKMILSAVIALTSATAIAEVTSTIKWKSTQIFRGGVYTNNGTPMIQGEMEYKHESGFIAGAWAANLISKDTDEGVPPLFDFQYEFNHYLGYVHKTDNWSLKGQLVRYYFPQKQSMDSYDLILTFKMKGLTALLSYMPEFFQWTDTDQIYVSLDYEYLVRDNLYLVPHVGYSKYSKGGYDAGANLMEGGRLHQDYSDYSIAVRHKKDNWVMEMGFSGTDRKLANATVEQKADDRPFMNASYSF